MYECEICKYPKTDNYYGLKQHNRSDKHNSNCIGKKGVYTCSYCKSCFKQREKKNKHQMECMKNTKVIDKYKEEEEEVQVRNVNDINFKEEKTKYECKIQIYENEIKTFKDKEVKFTEEIRDLKLEIKDLKLEIKNKEDKYEEKLKDAEDKLKELFEENKELNNRLHENKDSLNIEIKKVMKDFNDNSVKNFNHCAEITKKTTGVAEILAKKCANANPISKLTSEDYERKFKIDKLFIRKFIYQYEANNGSKFLLDYINSIFLKEDKTEQSVFTTDISRLNYIIKELINKEDNKSSWVSDKSAVKVSELIVKPFVGIIQKHLQWYIGRELNKLSKCGETIDINYESDDEENINEFINIDVLKRIKNGDCENSEEEEIYKKNKKLEKTKRLYKKIKPQEENYIRNEYVTGMKILKSINDESFVKEIIRHMAKFYQVDKSFLE